MKQHPPCKYCEYCRRDKVAEFYGKEDRVPRKLIFEVWGAEKDRATNFETGPDGLTEYTRAIRCALISLEHRPLSETDKNGEGIMNESCSNNEKPIPSTE